MERDHDGTPIFDGEDDAAATLENPDLSRDDRLAAELALDAMRSGYTASELDGYATISTGQADDLKHETADGLRYWLSRCGVEDGEPFEHTVTIERQVDGRWENAARYDGGELPEPNEFEAGRFALIVDLGNEAMSSGEDVADALARVASEVGEADTAEGPIRDGNGNTVGRFEVDAEGTRRPILTHDAYRILCGLVHPSEAVDPAEVVGPDDAWKLLRHLFPLSDARLAGEEG